MEGNNPEEHCRVWHCKHCFWHMLPPLNPFSSAASSTPEHFSGLDPSICCVYGKFKAWAQVLAVPPHICSHLMEKRFLLAQHFVAPTAPHGVGRYWWTSPNQSKTQWRFPSRIFHNVDWNQLEKKPRHKKDKYWKSWYGQEQCQSLLHPRQCQFYQIAFHDVHIAQPNYFLFI